MICLSAATALAAAGLIVIGPMLCDKLCNCVRKSKKK